MSSEAERLTALEEEVERLKIKLEKLLEFLQVSHLGPPSGRKPYDAIVKKALEEADLSE